jgi:hypothetical protein
MSHRLIWKAGLPKQIGNPAFLSGKTKKGGNDALKILVSGSIGRFFCDLNLAACLLWVIKATRIPVEDYAVYREYCRMMKDSRGDRILLRKQR